MIFTLTLNPCVDKTITVDGFGIGATNRVKEYTKSVCGKGINTATVIKNLGREVLAFAVEYEEGPSVEKALKARGIDSCCVRVPGELRTNVKIFDSVSGITTELNEKGGAVPDGEITELVNKILAKVQSGDVFVMSGSVPQGVPKNIYAILIEKLKARGAYTILDADGDLLANGIKACPDMIKPNRDELSALLGRDVKTLEESVAAAKELCKSGVGAVCVSLGGDGAIFVKNGECFKAKNTLGNVKGTVGAGDSMVAGFAVGTAEVLSALETLRMATAAAAGSISLPSTELCTLELYNEMLRCVTVERL